jgi:hypothetical protein
LQVAADVTAHAIILAERQARLTVEANAAVAKAEAANAQADLSSSEALIVTSGVNLS